MGEEGDEFVFGWGGSVKVVGADEVVGGFSAKLPGNFAPERVNFEVCVDSGFAGVLVGSVDDDDVCGGRVTDVEFGEDGGESVEGAEWFCLFGDVVDGEKAVGFSAAKCGFQLDDRIPAGSGDAAEDGFDELFHSFGDVGHLEEQFGVLVFFSGTSLVDGGDVCGEFCLLEVAAADVVTRFCNLSPWF